MRLSFGLSGRQRRNTTNRATGAEINAEAGAETDVEAGAETDAETGAQADAETSTETHRGRRRDATDKGPKNNSPKGQRPT